MAQLPKQSHPRRKISELQKKGYLLRIKKGLYIFTKEYIGKMYSPEIIANLIYGPSYVSLEYALSRYGLIPEKVEVVTNITLGKNKDYHTPIGTYSYSHLSLKLYPLGLRLDHNEDHRTFLIASPEKALLDKFSLHFDSAQKPQKKDISSALWEDLRLDKNKYLSLRDLKLLNSLKPYYKNRPWSKLLIEYLMELKSKTPYRT